MIYWPPIVQTDWSEYYNHGTNNVNDSVTIMSSLVLNTVAILVSWSLGAMVDHYCKTCYLLVWFKRAWHKMVTLTQEHKKSVFGSTWLSFYQQAMFSAYPTSHSFTCTNQYQKSLGEFHRVLTLLLALNTCGIGFPIGGATACSDWCNYQSWQLWWQ